MKQASTLASVTVQQHDITVTAHTAGADTVGQWSLVDITLARYACGPPLHLHTHTTEKLTVLEGLLVCTLGTRTIIMEPGDSIELPPGMAHTGFNPTAAATRLHLWRGPALSEQPSLYPKHLNRGIVRRNGVM